MFPDPRLRHWKGHDILHFSFSDSITKYQVNNATMYVYVRGTERRPAPVFTLDVFKVYKYDSPGTVKVASKKMSQPTGHGAWVKVDVTAVVSEWFKSAKDNVGIVLNGTVDGRRVLVTERAGDGGKKVSALNADVDDVQQLATRYVFGHNIDE